MKIKEVLYTVCESGLFNKDLMAMKAGAKADGFTYIGEPVTPGFKRIVQPGAAISIMLRLEDGQVAFGDCSDVIFAGAAGRDPLFQPAEHEGFIQGELKERLTGRDISRFRPVAEEIDKLSWQGKRLHTALRYGISQALLNATSLAGHAPMARVISDEYGCPIARKPVPILVSAGTREWARLDRVILKKADLLPHSSFTNAERDLGLQGEKLLEYAGQVVKRIKEIGEPGYRPTIHLDCYGTMGDLYGGDIERVASYIGKVKEVVGDLDLMIEAPIIAENRAAQIEAYQALCAVVRRHGHGTQIIVDEWCNDLQDVKDFADAGAGDLLQIKMPDLGGLTDTIEGVLYARGKGLGVSLGGSLNETDQASRISAHVALATQPTYIYAKPGNGGDEGFMIQKNEMLRTLVLLGVRP